MQSRLDVLAMHPARPGFCIRAPVLGWRSNTPSAPDRKDAVYTLTPSGDTVSPSGSRSLRPGPQPRVSRFITQPEAPTGCVSCPLPAARLNIAILWDTPAVTYTLRLSGLKATASEPLSALAVPQPLRGV